MPKRSGLRAVLGTGSIRQGGSEHSANPSDHSGWNNHEYHGPELSVGNVGRDLQRGDARRYLQLQCRDNHRHLASGAVAGQPLKQAQLVLVLVAFGVVEQGAGGQAEYADQLQEWKSTARFLTSGLEISTLIFPGIGQADAGAINNFDTEPLPEFTGAVSAGGQGATQPWQDVPRQTQPCLAIGAGARAGTVLGVQGTQSQDLADNFPAGTFGFEHLKQESKERAADGINSLAAVGPLVGLRQKSRRQQWVKQQI